jgi:hypothetical protein
MMFTYDASCCHSVDVSSWLDKRAVFLEGHHDEICEGQYRSADGSSRAHYDASCSDHKEDLRPSTQMVLALPFQWALSLGVLVAVSYSIGLIGVVRRWGPVVVCGAVALDSIDVIGGLMNSINTSYAVGGSIFSFSYS